MTEEDCLRRDVIKQLICNFKLALEESNLLFNSLLEIEQEL